MKFVKNLKNSEEILQTIDHIISVTYPLFKDKKILIKLMLELKIATLKIIESILQYEYIQKRIKLSKKSSENFKIFEKKSASKYQIDDKEIDSIKFIFKIAEKHKTSKMEFVRGNKVIILDEKSNYEILDLKIIKHHLKITKNILEKVKKKLKK